GKRIYDRAGLTSKKALVAASLGGREHMFGRNAIHGELTGMLRHLLQGTLGYCGFQVLTPFFAYHVPYLSDEDRRDLLHSYKAHLDHGEALPALLMPSLDHYDAILRPMASAASEGNANIADG